MNNGSMCFIYLSSFESLFITKVVQRDGLLLQHRRPPRALRWRLCNQYGRVRLLLLRQACVKPF
jgi:hypothetical protein